MGGAGQGAGQCFQGVLVMSEKGHKRTSPDVQRMSALTLKADMRGRIRVDIWLFVYEPTP
jgi:hypothetical protein